MQMIRSPIFRIPYYRCDQLFTVWSVTKEVQHIFLSDPQNQGDILIIQLGKNDVNLKHLLG